MQEIEAGNQRLDRLMDRLVHEGAEFETLTGGARDLMTASARRRRPFGSPPRAMRRRAQS
jgi:hypothetical protein